MDARNQRSKPAPKNLGASLWRRSMEVVEHPNAKGHGLVRVIETRAATNFPALDRGDRITALLTLDRREARELRDYLNSFIEYDAEQVRGAAEAPAHYFFVSKAGRIICAECHEDRTPKPWGPIDTSGVCTPTGTEEGGAG